MSVGKVGDGVSESDSESARFAAALADDEEVRLTWSATDVHWADEWRSGPDETTFVATDRRIVFADGGSTTSIGYGHVRAVVVDPASDGVDLGTAFLASGGISLLTGLLTATVNPLRGLWLVALSVALLVAGGAARGSTDVATITIVIDNERQRLSFDAEESVGAQLTALVDEH